MSDQPTLIGVDTGGTFTDIICCKGSGQLQVHKLLSTPADASQAIGEGVAHITDDDPGAVEVIHGTTVATNALLERQGSKVAFVTTAGFEDLLWLRRQARPELYALQVQTEDPLVAEAMSFGVTERLNARGEVITALSDEAIADVVAKVAATEAEAVVVCLLHAYANDAHEQRLVAAFRDHERHWHVSGACEITATFREYERATTATINGYVGPVMARYLGRLNRRLSQVQRIEILQSHGGRADIEQARRLPVHTVLSGPAGGVVGAVGAASEAGINKTISFDMGGTSSDISLADGAPRLSEEGTIGGLPLQVPVIDIYTVGAGGGSLAWVDAGGALRVGPRSAGADPGPAAYGRGGQEPTVTDAHVVLGSLRPAQFLGGTMALDEAAARAAVDGLARSLGEDRQTTARGILDVADAAMARAIKVISLERGHDLRDYALVAFGGAGGLHGCRLAKRLDITEVIIPEHPGLLSAVGMLRADARRLYSQTVLRPLKAVLSSAGRPEVVSMMADLQARAMAAMDNEQCVLEWTASLRYQGQSYAIAVSVDWDPVRQSWENPRRKFEEEHERLYGYRARSRPIDVVDLRLEARLPAPDWSQRRKGATGGDGDPSSTATIDLGDGPATTTVVDRKHLGADDVVTGPAVITEYSGTTVVLAGWSARLVAGHLVLRPEEQGGAR